MIIFKFILVIIFPLVAPFCLAQVVAPDELLKAITLDAIAIIRQDEDAPSANPAKVADLVEARIQPVFAFAHMTQTAMARNWRLATPEQQKALTLEFKTLLVRTFCIALSSYRNQAIEFKRLHAASGDTDVTVKSVVKQQGTPPLTIDYDMEKMAAGWQVYDIKIGGVSLIETYRETFASKVREGGVDRLIKSLADKNTQGGGRSQQRASDNFYFPIIVRGVLLSGR